MGDPINGRSKKKKTKMKTKKRGCWKSQQQQQLQLQLPEDMILEILLRVPAKFLCRFKCVSKGWRSMIESHVFVSAHSARSSANPKLLLCVEHGEGDFVFSADKDESCRRCCYHGSTTCRVLGSEGGLLCSYDYDRKVIHVANPSTGECFSSPCPCPSPRPRGREKSLVCFGYHPVENKHKVLIIRWESQKPISTVDIFTIGRDKGWRTLINPSGLPDIQSISCPRYQSKMMSSICIDGVIYFIVRSMSSSFWLVSFDLQLETFRAIPIPDEASSGPGSRFCVMGFRGAAAFLEDPQILVLRKDKLTLWILDGVLWSSRDFLIPLSMPLQLVGVTAQGEVIIAPTFFSKASNGYFDHAGSSTIYLCHLQSSTIKTITIHGYVSRVGLFYDMGGLYYDLGLFYHIENMQPLRDLVAPITTRTGLGASKVFSFRDGPNSSICQFGGFDVSDALRLYMMIEEVRVCLYLPAS